MVKSLSMASNDALLFSVTALSGKRLSFEINLGRYLSCRYIGPPRCQLPDAPKAPELPGPSPELIPVLGYNMI